MSVILALFVLLALVAPACAQINYQIPANGPSSKQGTIVCNPSASCVTQGNTTTINLGSGGGPTGPTGPAGPVGAPGATGPMGPTGPASGSSFQGSTATVQCPNGGQFMTGITVALSPSGALSLAPLCAP
jgi:hypothetical protein